MPPSGGRYRSHYYLGFDIAEYSPHRPDHGGIKIVAIRQQMTLLGQFKFFDVPPGDRIRNHIYNKVPCIVTVKRE